MIYLNLNFLNDTLILFYQIRNKLNLLFKAAILFIENVVMKTYIKGIE